MKRRALKSILLSFSFLIVALVALILIYDYRSGHKVTEAYRQLFPDGTRTLVISHIGDPIFPYGEDRMKVTILNGKETVYDSLVMVKNDGVRGRFDVKWVDGNPIVTLSGDEMEDITLTLP